LLNQVVADEEKVKQGAGLQLPEESSAERKDDEHAVGQMQAEEADTGHCGDVMAREENVQSGDSRKEQNVKRRQRLQESDSNRSLGGLCSCLFTASPRLLL
jgi:hypothetical protein